MTTFPQKQLSAQFMPKEIVSAFAPFLSPFHTLAKCTRDHLSSQRGCSQWKKKIFLCILSNLFRLTWEEEFQKVRNLSCSFLSPFNNIPLASYLLSFTGWDELQGISLLLGLRFNLKTLSSAILPFSTDCSLSAG